MERTTILNFGLRIFRSILIVLYEGDIDDKSLLT